MRSGIMGNVITVISPTWTEADQENLLLSELSKLPPVELQKVNWCLSQNVLQNFPPIPPHWLQPDDAHSTTNTMLHCYQEGALRMLPTVLTMIGRDDQVSHLPKNLPPIRALPSTLTADPSPPPGFLTRQRRKLISMMQWPDAILGILQERHVLTAANGEAISIFAVLRDKNRALVDLVLRKQVKAQEDFYHALNQSEPFLVQELNSDGSKGKESSDPGTLQGMLEWLDPEELTTFQWLVSDQLSDSGELENADTQTTWRLLEKKFGPSATRISFDILQTMIAPNSLCLENTGMESEKPDTKTTSTPELNTPRFRVNEDSNMFRLTCPRSDLFCCDLTGLRLEGAGDVVYQTVPWDVDFLSSKGLRPAGPLFKFTLLSGSFHRLHLPHCQLPSDGSLSLLSVAHVTEERVDFITPDEVTDDHVVVGVSGFSCYGLAIADVLPEQSATAKHPLTVGDTIKGLVLLFFEQSVEPEIDSSLFILLLPRNAVIDQVIKDWRTRNRRASYLQVTSDCELIRDQTYQPKATQATLIQPKSARFLNYSDYHNFVPSFEVRLKAHERKLDIELWTKVSSLLVIGWLLGPSGNLVWQQNIQLKGAASTSQAPVPELDTPVLLLKTLNLLRKDDFKTFRHSLSLEPDPIPLFQLEEAERTTVVELMVQKYNPEGAKEIMRELLKRMGNNQQASYLETTCVITC